MRVILIGRALADVVRNAIRATARDGRIALKGALDQASAALGIEASDTGTGVVDGLREALLEPAVTGPDTGPVTGRTDGIGLGLAVLRERVAARGVRRTLPDSAPGGGTRCEIAPPRERR